jgi:hypothetical protein
MAIVRRAPTQRRCQMFGDCRIPRRRHGRAASIRKVNSSSLTSGILAALTCVVTVCARMPPADDSLISAYRDVTVTVLDGLAAGVSTLYLYGHTFALIDRHLALSLRPSARYRRLVGGSGRARLVVVAVWMYSAAIATIVCIPGRSGIQATVANDRHAGHWSTLPTIAERRLPIASFAFGFAISFTVAFSVIYQRCRRRKLSRDWSAAATDSQPPKLKYNRFETSVVVSYVLCVVFWSVDVCLRVVIWVGVTDVGFIDGGVSHTTDVVQQMALLCGLTAGVLAPCVYLTVGGACRWLAGPPYD